MTLTFESLEELMGFVKKMTGEKGTAAPMPAQPAYTAPVTPVQPPAYTAPVTPVQPPAYTAPVTPVQPPTYTAPAAPVHPPAPTSAAPGYTLEDLTSAAIPLMDSGRQPELLHLIASFGVEALPALRPDQYGAFATALRGLGARI